MVCDLNLQGKDNAERVLILILLEYGLRHALFYRNGAKIYCLNPYSTGIWSATPQKSGLPRLVGVLILILLEYGLRQSVDLSKAELITCLNPYSTGIWSATDERITFVLNKELS